MLTVIRFNDDSGGCDVKIKWRNWRSQRNGLRHVIVGENNELEKGQKRKELPEQTKTFHILWQGQC